MDSSSHGNIDKHFKGQQEFEELVAVFRKHWVILIPQLFGFWLLTGLFFLLLWYLNNNPPAQIGQVWYYQALAFGVILVVTFLIHKFFNHLLNYYLEVVILTNYRTIFLKKSLFLNDEKNAIDLHEIQDIRKSQQGLIKNFLDYGELIITLSGTNLSMSLNHVPRPDKYFRAINLAKRNYILQRREQKGVERPVMEASNVLNEV